TADGSGNTLENDDDNPGSSTASSTAGQATVPGAGTTALGAPVQQPSPPLQPVGLNGTTIVEADGNETIETAVQTSIGTVVVGAIATRGDADFYRLSIPGRGELKVEFTRSPAEVNLTFRILNHDGIVVSGWHTAPQSGAVFEKRIDIVKAGEILIEVRDAYNDASSSGEYRMQTTFIPAQDDASEPNNVLAQATPLSWNVATRANILPRGDADLYLVSAPRQGRMTVEFTESGPETGITFRVLDKSGKVVRSWQSAPSAGELYQAWADLPEPANYFVEVRDSYNDARSATPYVIVASLDQTPDNGEPNNAVAVATPLAIGQGLDASILPKGDADNYALKIPHQGELTLEFPRSAPNTNLTFRILSETGKVVRTWQTASAAGEPHKGSADIAEPGDYILEVRDAYNDAASPFPYRLETRFKPTEDWAEPNNSNSASTEITLDGNYSANILPKGDADIYSVDIDHPGILEISVTESAPETNMTVRVLDIAGAVVSNWGTAPAAGKPFEATADVSSAGTYLIEIRDAYNDARSADPYRFSVQHKRSTDVLEPNDTANDARAISFGQNVAAAIFPKGDHDLYKFAVANPGEVSIQLTQSPADLNMVFQIERPDGSVVSSWRGASKRGDLFRIGVNIDQAGTYYLRFADSYSDARATEAYGFSVSLD
ncbi:MAG: PPC domain-containing protein, partial [Pseudomonadota bacterium]